MTDQQFFQKEYLYLKPWEKVVTWLVPLITVFILCFATWFLFISKPDEPCDPIDKVGAWCRVHPTTWWDILGAILFYWGGLWISSLTPRFFIGIDIMSDDSDWFPILNILAFVLGIIGCMIMYAV